MKIIPSPEDMALRYYIRFRLVNPTVRVGTFLPLLFEQIDYLKPILLGYLFVNIHELHVYRQRELQ